MPVTVKVAPTEPVAWTRQKAETPGQLLEGSLRDGRARTLSRSIIQGGISTAEGLAGAHITPSDNGFVWAAYHAYCTHHHLVIRPDDVWFTIITQVSFFINAHAEELREFFVEHSGQENLQAVSEVRDFGALSLQMSSLIAAKVKDPALCDWIMPDFTTTTHHDRVVGAVLFMGAMKAYFRYKMMICCGIPSVTLLGEVGDWEKLLARVDKLDELGPEPQQFARLLRHVLRHMVMTFREPDSQAVNDFWNKIVSHHPVGSGTDYISGWLTAFCFWDLDGKAKGVFQTARSFDFMSTPADQVGGGLLFPCVDIDDIPQAVASVPVEVDDFGDKYKATMVAGCVGIAASAAPQASSSPAALTSIQPVAGWWICREG